MTGRPVSAPEPGRRPPEFWYTLAISPQLRERHPELPPSLEEVLARGELQPAAEAQAEPEAAPEAFLDAAPEGFLEPELEAEI